MNKKINGCGFSFSRSLPRPLPLITILLLVLVNPYKIQFLFGFVMATHELLVILMSHVETSSRDDSLDPLICLCRALVLLLLRR